MALFFDADWFAARLRDVGLTSAQLGQALGLDEASMAAVFKDQRMLSDQEFRVMALLLDVPEAEVRTRAGVQGPTAASDAPILAQGALMPGLANGPVTRADLDAIDSRLSRIETILAALLDRLPEGRF